MIKRFLLIGVVTVSILLSSCGVKVQNPSQADKPVEEQTFAMGTIITQRVYGPNAKLAVDEVVERIKQIEKKMTINAPGSEVDQLNEKAGEEYVKLGSDTMYVLEKAATYARQSHGAFDPTVGPLVKAWGVFTDHPRVPPQAEIDGLLKLVGYKDLLLDKENSSAKLQRKGQIVDLGGIAKGYTGDEAINIYKKNGIVSAFVNLGGNVVVLGGKPDGSPWRVGVQNPRKENGEYLGIIQVKDKAIVSSGDYERFFEKDNVRYHHIIDTATGYPAKSGLIATTIVTDISIDADALSTATFVLGLDRGMELINSLEGVEALFITEDKNVYVTDGMRDIFTFDDESKEFHYVEKR